MKPLMICFVLCFVLLLLLSCSKTNSRLGDACKEVIESDSFYYAAPLDGQYKAMNPLKNYLTQVNDSNVQTIDFDCAVVVYPTNAQLDSLRAFLDEDIDEALMLNTRHVEAVICIIESKGIRTVKATGQFVRLKAKTHTWDLDVQKDTFPDWKFILFKSGKDPIILSSLTMAVEDVEEYFKNKE